jgi:hypothetical protein
MSEFYTLDTDGRILRDIQCDLKWIQLAQNVVQLYDFEKMMNELSGFVKTSNTLAS